MNILKNVCFAHSPQTCPFPSSSIIIIIIIAIIIIIIIIITTIIIIIIIISSSSSTQRSARRAVDEMHAFQKKVFSPRPEASFQVYFNAKTHILRLRCNNILKKEKNSPRRDAPFRVCIYIMQTTLRSAAKVM